MGAQLSLICAIYKVREYIPDLIDSLIRGANHPEVQIIFVNDCTPDDSMELCRKLLVDRTAEIRFTVKLFDRDRNGGVAAARNSAMALVDTPYVGTIDPDDAIDPFYYRILQPLVTAAVWDVIEFGYIEFNGTLPKPIGATGRRMPSSQLNPYRTGFFLWLRLFRTSLLTQMTYPEGMLYEDVRIVPEAYARSHSSIRISNRLVYYRRRHGAITSHRNRRYAEQLVNLVAGTQAGVHLQSNPASAVALATRRALVILLKGARIRDRQERAHFFAACRDPLSQLTNLVSTYDKGRAGALWMLACRGWLGLQRLSGYA